MRYPRKSLAIQWLNGSSDLLVTVDVDWNEVDIRGSWLKAWEKQDYEVFALDDRAEDCFFLNLRAAKCFTVTAWQPEDKRPVSAPPPPPDAWIS